MTVESMVRYIALSSRKRGGRVTGITFMLRLVRSWYLQYFSNDEAVIPGLAACFGVVIATLVACSSGFDVHRSCLPVAGLINHLIVRRIPSQIRFFNGLRCFGALTNFLFVLVPLTWGNWCCWSMSNCRSWSLRVGRC